MKEKDTYKQNGLTLISLVVTIIILLILAGISISTLSGDHGILKQAITAKQETEEASIKETIKLSYITAKMLGGNISKNMKEGLEETYGTGKVNVITPDNENYQIEIDKIGTYTLEENGEIQVGAYQPQNIPEGWVTTNIANDENTWYAYKDPDGNIAEVNAPKLASGMKAIKYETENTELVEGSQWANAMTKDGSMWVWIPRFAYRITSGYHQNADEIGGTGAGKIEIAFLKGSTNEFLDSSITGTVVTSGVTEETYADATKWILEPGFEFGEEHLTGFWFAKFEASNTDGYGDSSGTANNTNLTLQVKPNVKSWRSIIPYNIFTVCKNLTEDNNYRIYFKSVDNVDTHMTKNIEWGAVAYLAHSKYGLNGQEICINIDSSCKTGMGSGSLSFSSNVSEQYNTTIGVFASTTKNVYGIYDMSGGAWEYVAACYEGVESILTLNTDVTYIRKYIDVYSIYDVSKYGDALWETSDITNSNGSYSWFNNYSFFFASKEYPILKRGGSCDNMSHPGLFSFHDDDLIIRYTGGFRPVCVVK